MKKGTWLVTLVASVAAFACGEPVQTVDMVQPHYVAKSLFQGEWLYKQTVVDVSPELTATFVGHEGGMEKIHGKVGADYLWAYRTHEAIPGLDDDAGLAGNDYRGDPVAACGIVKHFDIKQGYNAATGELRITLQLGEYCLI